MHPWLVQQRRDQRNQPNQSQSHSAIVLQLDCRPLSSLQCVAPIPATTLRTRNLSEYTTAGVPQIAAAVHTQYYKLRKHPAPSYNMQVLQGDCLSKHSA
jgi:hypothetical protein